MSDRLPTRTDLVDAHHARIRQLRNEATDCRTVARAYKTLADTIRSTPPENPLQIQARDHVAIFAMGQHEKAADAAIMREAHADRLEEQGYIG